MVGDNRISAVLVSTDLDRSRDFYENTVGLKLSPETIPNHLIFDCGNGTTLLVYGRGSGNAADHTQVRFWTSDVARDVAELVERGVVFEEYDLPGLKTLNGIAVITGNYPSKGGVGEKGVWFRDSEGNLLGIGQAIR